MSRALRAVALALTGVLLLTGAGCGYDPTEVPEAKPSAQPSAAAPTIPPECGDPLRSYAPDGTLPNPGALPSGSTMAKIRQRGRLIAGVSADTFLLGARNPFTGAVEGFDIDMVKQVAQAIFGDEDRYQLRVITAADRIPILESAEVDIVVRNMTINCSRWEQIAFSAEYYRSGQKILVRRESDIRGLADLDGRRVCAPAGTSSFENLRKLAPEAVAVSASNHTGCLVRFQQGDVDAITGDDTVLAGLAAQDPYAVVVDEDAFTSEPYGIAMNAENVDLVRFVNAVLENMRATGDWDASYKTWLAPTLGRGTGQPQPHYGRVP
ncbi:MAG: glutamate ABC transporter substrate-binding protein [Pseudonocardia sp.]